MKSEKKVVPLDQILKPFTFTPTTTISGSVNGKSFYFPAGRSSTLTYSEYEDLVNSDYAEHLRD